jgi:NAD(P)-dependent dehydrogenase (short-subunit alcohol dehydrogenase family)
MPIAIVTGGNSGIGRGAALALAKRGFDLGITWHSDEENVEEAVAELEAEGVRVETRQVDLAEVPGPDAVIDELADALGGLDAYVANAAAGHSTPFLELGFEEWEWVIRFALHAQFLTAQYCAAKHGITVNSVAPGEIATKMTGNEDTDPQSEHRDGVPLRRPGDANEVGAAAAFLASPEASYITGETLVVDGGMHLMAAMANQM